jgi:DNA-binding NarL/FixJ family response regulator
VVGEDQPIVREGIVHILQDGGFEVVATARDARELVQKVKAYRPDVVVTDIQMPPDRTDDGLRAALEIRAAQPSVGVLILSQFLEDRYAFDLVADGAQGVGISSRRRSATCACLPMPFNVSRLVDQRSIRTWLPGLSAVPVVTALSMC